MAKSKKKGSSVLKTIIIVLLLVLIGLLGMIGWNAYQCLQPVQKESEEVAFEVVEGDTLASVSERLYEAGLINDPKISFYFARYYKKLGNLYAGKYTLDKSWTTEEIYTYLNDENNAKITYVTLTIVEGDWAKDVARKIASVTDVTYDELIELWNDEEWIRSIFEHYPFLTDEMFNEDVRIYLEGYLAPMTYYLYPETTAKEVTMTILDQTNKNYNELKELIDSSDLSIHEVFTLASIIQYEAGGSEEDLRKVAGVFYNRMAINMPLQSSVTVCYAIDFDKEVDNWQACEFNSTFDSPYNTYQYLGLPPGAIENPGIVALKAALDPIESDYYYFMADVYGDGTIYYAETLAEHEANIAKYLNGHE